MSLAQNLKDFAGRLGYVLQRKHSFRDATAHLVDKCQELGIATLFDVGANIGQFGRAARKAGYRDLIVSFEPVHKAHAILSNTAKCDNLWCVMPRMALGKEAGTAEINVAENLASSSLLPVNQRSVDAAPQSQFVALETIELRRLDTQVHQEWAKPYALKIDTQGFELDVLQGANEILNDIRLVSLEMSLAQLYKQGAPLMAVYGWLEQHGFRCIGLTEGFSDLARREMLQVDGLFIRD